MKGPHLHEVCHIRETAGTAQSVGHMPGSFVRRKIGTVAEIEDNGIAVVFGNNIGPRLTTRPTQDCTGPVPARPGVVSGWDLPERSVKNDIAKASMKKRVLPSSIQTDELVDSVIDLIFTKTANNFLLAVDNRFDQEAIKSRERTVPPGIAHTIGFLRQIGIILFDDLPLRLRNPFGQIQQALHPIP